MKKFLISAAVLLTALLAAVLILPLFFEGKIADTVKREANARLRAHLVFQKLELSLLRRFPYASIELKELTLVGESPFESDTILAADRISVVVNLLSLFGEEGFEVTKVILARPSLHARKLADGTVNWDVMKPVATEPRSQEASSEPSSFRLSVRDVRITDAALRYEDDSLRVCFSAAPVSLRMKGDLSAAQTDLSLRLKGVNMRLVSGGLTLIPRAEGELDAVLSADLVNKRFNLARNTLRLNAIEMSLGGWVDFSETDAIMMDVAAECRKVQFKDILSMIPTFYTRDFRQLSASGELTLSAWAKGRLSGGRVPAFEALLGVNGGSFQYSSLPGAVTDIALEARLSNKGGTMDDTKAELPLLAFKMGDNAVRASFSAARLFSDPDFEAAVSGRVDLGAIREVYPLKKGEEFGGVITADLRAAGRMSDIMHQRSEAVVASGTFVVEGVLARMEGLPEVRIRRAAATITPVDMTLGELDVSIGRSVLSANGRLSGYMGYLLRGTTLSGRLYVKSDLLDLNEIRSSLPAAQQESRTETSASVTDTPTVAVVVPENLDLTLSAELHEVLFQKMTLADIAGSMRVSGGGVSLDNLSGNAFGGRISASGRYATAADPLRPDLRLALDMSHASFLKTFEELEVVQQLVPLFAKTGGNYSMKLDLSTRLDASMTPDLKSFNAQGEIASEEIRVRNIEALTRLADALKYDPLRQIEAKDIKICFKVADGRVATEPFDLRIAGATIRLSGTTGLDQTIDYKARVSLPAGAAGGMLTTLNVGIGGTFSDPKITLGVKDAAEEVLKNLVNEQVLKHTGSASLEEELDKQKEKLHTAVEVGREKADAEVRKQIEKLREGARRGGEKLVEAAEEQRAKLVEGAKNPLAKAAAEKVGDKLVEAAQAQAAKLRADAESEIADLMDEKP